jgi:L-aminopeptidase/D-esterase-like protein
VLVQCNYGLRSQLRIAGAPVGDDLAAPLPCHRDSALAPRTARICGAPAPAGRGDEPGAIDGEQGSIIVVVATDAPLLPHQLKRVVKRASLGIGKMGGIGGNSSGDIFIAFSTATPQRRGGLIDARMIANDLINPVFDGTIQATEEAIVNALIAARTMVGANAFEVPALPHDALRAALAKYNRLAGAPR